MVTALLQRVRCEIWLADFFHWHHFMNLVLITFSVSFFLSSFLLPSFSFLSFFFFFVISSTHFHSALRMATFRAPRLASFFALLW